MKTITARHTYDNEETERIRVLWNEAKGYGKKVFESFVKLIEAGANLTKAEALIISARNKKEGKISQVGLTPYARMSVVAEVVNRPTTIEDGHVIFLDKKEGTAKVKEYSEVSSKAN